jgi:glycosyltransferase involved in cell wall biosynthesis
VTSQGGPGEIARQSESGLVVDPGAAGEVARAIERLLVDTTLARTHSERGRSWVVANASAERMATEFVRCYREVMGARPTRL